MLINTAVNIYFLYPSLYRDRYWHWSGC